ncbi:MAG: heavy metal translocating P-type ATPase [Rhodospirillaceae bacterium]|nr:heavy metal translocating P-type ATPase [Rhodospirillaceae bacterium]
MTNPSWFAALGIVHRLPGRVRLRYRLTAAAVRADIDRLVLASAAIPGLTEIKANAAARSLVLTFDPALTTPEILRDVLWAVPIPDEAPPPPNGETEDRQAARNAGASLAALLGSPILPRPARLPVSLMVAQPVYARAFEDYRAERKVTSHVLEAMAVSISLARADYTAANTTSFLLALGDYLESSIARRSEELLKTLLRPAGDQAWVLRGKEEIQVPVASLAIGDKVVVATGTVVPIDGTVLSGTATVNEAAMTGESVSVVKKRGSSMLSGTLIEEGRLVVYAEQVGEKTAVARIADYVEQSLKTKSDAQLEASRMAERMVPSVLTLAGLSYVLSGDWRRTASVLQGDYSCALKLATPVAFKSAMYEAGRAGILVKGATALEKLAQADTVIFDKTGTLTTGSLDVTDVIPFDPSFSPDDLICLAASVEEHYFHPLAMAVVAAAKITPNRHFAHQDVEFIVAHGVASVIDGKRIVVGSRHFVEDDEGIDIHPYDATVDGLYRDGKTLLFIGLDGVLLGLLALKDSLRDNSARTVRRLRALGVKQILLLTGDHEDRARELAQMLGLDGYHAGLLPEDKARIIDTLNAQGAHIAFVGDGINDAPALAGAHVGIAMQKGADIARLTADIALLEDDVERVADAKAIANAAMRLIGTNYRLTVGINSAILSAAALGLLSPIATALLHNSTTVGILLNALRRNYRGPTPEDRV